ncbi:hypothetical protein C7B82_10000 [Stenomitos frigidus ULC18]|uniref:Uncharacterized protein n=1 Tax=Stenomitos frigidus ULC18 TaxID=2107698 RepID=A0A2T1EAV7_9CYAN|nr:hypothetical protein C7B82_10000 [Stenomitos frigidus ULC18]
MFISLWSHFANLHNLDMLAIVGEQSSSANQKKFIHQTPFTSLFSKSDRFCETVDKIYSK